MRNERDDFSSKTKDLLAKRVAYKCSNPNCRKPTIGPNSEKYRTVSIGVAAHISAAAEGGKRYNKELSSDERKDYSNGIWLCQSCAKLIDSDEDKYSLIVINMWKKTAEETALREIETNTQKQNDFIIKIEEDDLKHDLYQIHSIKKEYIKLKNLLRDNDFVAPFPVEIFILIETIDQLLNNVEFNDGKINELTSQYLFCVQEFSDLLIKYTRHIPNSAMGIMKRIEPHGEIVDEDFYDVQNMMFKKRESLYNSIIVLLSVEGKLKQKLIESL